MTATETPKRTLFDIGEDLIALMQLAEEAGGEVTGPEWDEWFAELSADEGRKLDGYVGLIRTAEMEEAAAKAEAERWQKRASVRANLQRNLKERIRQYLDYTGRTKVQTSTGRTISVQKNGGKPPLEIDPVDPNQVPECFRTLRVEINRERVRLDLDEGCELPFARLLPPGNHVRIR